MKNFWRTLQKKSQIKEETDGSKISNVLTSVIENVTSAEFACTEEEIKNTYESPKKMLSRNSCED